MYRHPNWDLAESVLSRVIPGSTGFDPERIRGLAPDKWQVLDIDNRDPLLVVEDLLRYCQPILAGVLILVTLESYKSDTGPFFISSGRFAEFVRGYADFFGDVITAADVVVLSPSMGVVVVVHHDGLVATLDGLSVNFDTSD